MAKKTQAEAKAIVSTLLQKAEFARQQAQERNERFEVLDEKRLLKKTMGKGSNSPYFYAQGWGPNVSPGGSTSYTAYVNNPDPTSYSGSWLYAYLFFGPSNFITDSDLALTVWLRQFPHYFQQVSVAANSTASAAFTIDVPAGIADGYYIGNCFLVQRDSFDVGTYFDRAAFYLNVS